MARIFGRLPENAAERKVVLALKEQLPAGWVVVPDVRWARQSGGRLCDGEADVVVLAPALGMLVVEVKGSREFRVTRDGWERLDPSGAWTALDRTPVEQAMSNAHELKRIVCDALRIGPAFPGLHGWLVVYPNGHASSVPALFDHRTLATRSDMRNLFARVRDALLARGSAELGARFSEAVAEKVETILTSSDFRVLPADGEEEVGSDKDAIEVLTGQQFAALRGLFGFPSVAVAGPAGSGKTLLALQRMEAELQAGRRALYACYNKRLAEVLRLKSPGLASKIHSVDSLFGRTCPWLARKGDDDVFHRRELPNAVFDVVSGWAEGDKFDAVIVDEAQDLSDSQVIALNAFVKQGGSWSVFIDQRQDLYGKRLDEALMTDVLFRLAHNCRNTTCINDKTNRLLGTAIDSMPGMPRGVPVLVESMKRTQMANRAFQLAREWGAGGANTVAILSPYVLAKSAMADVPRGHGISLTTDLNGLHASGTAYFSTIKSFKGIEADCVILVDADHPDHGNPAFTREDLYVACTRAKTRLAILTQEGMAAGYYEG